MVQAESVKWNTLFDQLEEWESHLKAENIDVDAILEAPSRKPVRRRAPQMRGPSR